MSYDSSMKCYKLVDKRPVRCNISETSGTTEQDRVVQRTTHRNITVSTVFLTIDHQYGNGPPLLFETMVFGYSIDEYQDRYSTWDEAVAGHKKMCEKVFGVQNVLSSMIKKLK